VLTAGAANADILGAAALKNMGPTGVKLALTIIKNAGIGGTGSAGQEEAQQLSAKGSITDPSKVWGSAITGAVESGISTAGSESAGLQGLKSGAEEIAGGDLQHVPFRNQQIVANSKQANLLTGAVGDLSGAIGTGIDDYYQNTKASGQQQNANSLFPDPQAGATGDSARYVGGDGPD
jgi:hypothetical protein